MIGEARTPVSGSAEIGGILPFEPSPILPHWLELTPQSRNPLRLAETTLEVAQKDPTPMCWVCPPAESPVASIVMVTSNTLTLTKLCLASLLGNSEGRAFEVIIVDNASADRSREYLSRLADRVPSVRLAFNETNRGLAPVTNQGLVLARG